MLMTDCAGRAATTPGGTGGNGLGGSSGSAEVAGSFSSGNGGAPFVDASTLPCKFNSDCPAPPPPARCIKCFDGSIGCIGAVCVAGSCGVSSIPICLGSPCSSAPTCEDGACPPCRGCTNCQTADGGCYSGFCDTGDACRRTMAECTSPQSGCGPMEAVGAPYLSGENCKTIWGWVWDGAKCSPVVGCQCVGADCDGYVDEETCVLAQRQRCP
jgi:hypothetical protein